MTAPKIKDKNASISFSFLIHSATNWGQPKYLMSFAIFFQLLFGNTQNGYFKMVPFQSENHRKRIQTILPYFHAFFLIPEKTG